MRSRFVGLLVAGLMIAGAVNVAAFDVSVTAPQVTLTGALKDYADFLADQQDFDVIGELNTELATLSIEFKNELETNEDLIKFSNQPSLTRGFANAGSAAAHLGTQRSFIDYRRFAFVIGTGAALSSPSSDVAEALDAVERIEEKGDIYAGAAIQPLSASLGINLSRLVDGLRMNVKVGYFSVPKGTVSEELSFESLSVGAGFSYQVLQSRSLPLGIIRWRGLSVASGVNFQRNNTDFEFTASSEDFETTGEITFGEIFDIPDGETITIDETVIAAEDPFGSLTITPTLVAAIESRTYSVPIEVNTGFRILYLLDFNVGAGVDLAMGSSEVSVGASTKVDFASGEKAEEYVDFKAGQANLGIKTTNEPQFVRPRITAGFVANLGPIKLDVPLMYYFDDDGPGAMVGVNVGLVW